VQGKHAISKVKQIIGDKDPKLSSMMKNTMRSFYATDRFDNAFFVSENFSESLVERDFLFAEEIATGQGGSVVPKGDKAQEEQKSDKKTISPMDLIMAAKMPELAILVIGPTLVRSGDFIYIIDDIHRQKFNICGVRKSPVKKFDVQALFGDQARNYDVEVLWENEFKPSESADENDCLILVLEKEKAVTELQGLVGRNCKVLAKGDFDKCKKKQSAFGSSFGLNNSSQRSFIEDYGAYVYSFPGAPQNQRKVAHFFKRLLNSEYFKIVHRQLLL